MGYYICIDYNRMWEISYYTGVDIRVWKLKTG